MKEWCQWIVALYWILYWGAQPCFTYFLIALQAAVKLSSWKWTQVEDMQWSVHDDTQTGAT